MVAINRGPKATVRSTLRLLTIAAAILGTALLNVPPAAASGILPPVNPPANVLPSPTCSNPSGANDNDPGCANVMLSAIDAARAREGVGSMYLPSNWYQLTPAEQVFVVTNLERIDRRLNPYVGLVQSVTDGAQQGAVLGADPVPRMSSGVLGAQSILAVGEDNALGADYAWMYDDGPGGPNAACLPADHTGCWGHRDAILGSCGGLTDAGQNESCVAGAGFGSNVNGYLTSYTEELVETVAPLPPLTFSWATDVHS
jgi:hypothetical protein